MYQSLNRYGNKLWHLQKNSTLRYQSLNRYGNVSIFLEREGDAGINLSIGMETMLNRIKKWFNTAKYQSLNRYGNLH